MQKRATAMALKSKYFLGVLYFMAKEKSRYFTFLLYPESIPDDWELKLELLGIPIAISPLGSVAKFENQTSPL
jgi:hypothetical protein